MASKRAWESYSATFCAGEMEVLVNWIRAGQSGSVMGLPGAGKSNLLSFLSHRPDVVAQYLKDSSLKLAVVQVDLNSLPGNDLATFYRVILRSLYEASVQLAAIEKSLFETVETLYRKIEEKTDPFLTQSALRETLLSFQAREARLVLVMDPFDQFCRTAPTLVLDNLRGLRDGFKTTLVYIVGLRHELAYIRDPVELGELYEILDTHLCWVGPLTKDDARYSIAQVEEATGKSFGEQQIEQLIDLTGGYPALLRAATLWLARVSPAPDLSAWENRLLAEPSIQNRLKDLWRALTLEEQAVLSVWQMALATKSQKERQESLRQIERKYENVFARLRAKHLCVKTDSGWRFSGPLVARFVAEMEGISAGKIKRDPQTDRFFRGETELTDLSEQDRRLLRYFLDRPYAAHAINDLIEAVWPEDDSEGVTNWAVTTAIRHLRMRIEPNPAKPCYLITIPKAGYRFFPEGAPQS